MEVVAYRAFQPSDLPRAHELSQQAGWPHRLRDWEFVLALGQGVVAVDASGQVAATGLLWPQGEHFATLGMMIVSDGHRRQGIGREVMGRLLSMAGSRTIGLHATPDGLHLYETLGFRETGRIFQHQGVVQPGSAASELRGRKVRAAGKADEQALAVLDEEAFGAPRAAMIRALCGVAQAAVAERDGEVTGFAFRRPFGRGASIGPVVATDVDDARALLAYWISRSQGFLRVDVTMASESLSRWLGGCGLERVSTVRRMIRPGSTPEDPIGSEYFALVNQAVG